MSILDSDRVKLWNLQRIIDPELRRFDRTYARLLEGETPLIDTICRHILQGRSKRFRPTLLLLAAKQDGPVPDRAITAAVCIEMIHTATLLHDDFIDEAVTRRGLPSINQAWGPSTALVMGDYLYSKALDTLSHAGLFDAVTLLASTTLQMSQAEMMQLETKGALALDEQTYLTIIARKTASLIESACRIGASLNPRLAGREDAFALFGQRTGMVFQITDDIFDYLGDERRLGKPTGQDWEEGRITLPLIAALRQAAPGERERFLARVGDLDPQRWHAAWPLVKEFVRVHQGVEYARGVARRYGREAKDAIADLVEGPQQDLLAVSVEYVLKRLN